MIGIEQFITFTVRQTFFSTKLFEFFVEFVPFLFHIMVISLILFPSKSARMDHESQNQYVNKVIICTK